MIRLWESGFYSLISYLPLRPIHFVPAIPGRVGGPKEGALRDKIQKISNS